MSAFGSGSNSNGQFWYGPYGFLYKKNNGVGGRRSTKMAPGGNITCNSATYLYNQYKPGGGGVGASSIANRRAKNRLATICGPKNCFPYFTTLGQYNNSTNVNGFYPLPPNLIINSNNTPSTIYTVTYFGNGSDGGSVPIDGSSYASGSTVTVLGNGTLVYTGYVFTGWNTAADGSGTAYSAGNTFIINANTNLYAQWSPDESSYTVTYFGNGSDGGSVPVDGSSPYVFNATVTVLGNGTLVRSGYIFSRWNTVADNTGTAYLAGNTFTINASTTLYAQWIIAPPVSYTLT